MKVYGYRNNVEGIVDIKDTMEAFGEYVDGSVEMVSLTAEYVLLYNSGSSLDNEELEANVAWFDNDELVDVICGRCFVCRRTKEGFSGIEESDIPVIKRMLIQHKK